VEDAFEWLAEDGGYAEGGFQRRRVFSLFNCVDGLAGALDLVGQFLLRHLAVFKAQSSNFVANRAHLGTSPVLDDLAAGAHDFRSDENEQERVGVVRVSPTELAG